MVKDNTKCNDNGVLQSIGNNFIYGCYVLNTHAYSIWSVFLTTKKACEKLNREMVKQTIIIKTTWLCTPQECV